MDQFLRVVAVLLEVSVLAIMILCVLWGLKLLLVELGVSKKYDKALMMAFSALFCIWVFFTIMHLSAFYPAFSGS